MEITGRKSFKEPRRYYIYYFWVGILAIWETFALIHSTFFESEEEFVNHFINRKLAGNSGQRWIILMERQIAKYFGKPGLLMIPIGGIIGCAVGLYLKIAEHRRYLHKMKLYHEGIIKNIFDIYDDYERKSLFQWIRDLFRKRDKRFRAKPPSKRKMREMEEKMRRWD
jgi:hypothetical protein